MINEKLIDRIAKISLYTATNSEVSVLPKIYAKIFEEYCKLENIDLKDIDNSEVAQNLISESILHIDKLIKETKESLQSLQDLTSSAEIAIKNKDLEALSESEDSIKALKNRLLELEKELYYDSLTAVYNRKWLDEKAIDKSGKFLDEGYLAIIDLDKFKDINDNYGHIVGDKVLQFIAKKLSYFEDASVVRYGGDEFVVFFKKEASTEIAINAKLYSLQSELIKKDFTYNKNKFRIGFSYGVFLFKEGDTFSDVLDRVDNIMYDNKKENRLKIWNKY